MSVESAPAEDLRMDVGALMGALWARAIRIVLVSLFLVAVAYGVLMFVPKQYESSASLWIEDRSSVFTQPATASATTTGGSAVSIDAVISSLIELIKSRDTLMDVVDSQNLRSEPEFNGDAANPISAVLTLLGRQPQDKSVEETVLQNLNDRLTVIRERDSTVISIFVRSTNAEMAAKIAEALAEATVKRRATQQASDNGDAAKTLDAQIKILQQQVTDADAKVADFKAQNGIFAGVNGTTLPDQQISDVGKQITDAQALKNSAQQRADLIRSLLKSGAPVDGIDDVRNSAVVQALLQQRATLQTTLAEKLATLLPAHPTIQGLNAQISGLNTQIRAEAKRIADGLAAQVTVQDGIIGSLNDDLARAKLASTAQTKDGVTLSSLLLDADTKRNTLNAYKLKSTDAAGRTDPNAVLPDVRVLTRAAVSMVPASPKTGLILGAVGAVALVLQIGAVLFGELMSGRAVYDRNSVRQVEPEFLDEHDDEQDAEDEDVADEAEDEPDLADLPEADAPVAIADPGPEHEHEPEPEAAAVAPVAQRAAPEPEPEPRHRAVAAASLAISNLSADIALGRARVVLLAGVSEARDAAVLADMLVTDALHTGLSVCRVDAGSMRPSHELGLTDLCVDQASYGDIVHKVRGGLAEVPWGQTVTLDRRSGKPLTLIEALADIYEVVIVSTGRIGLNSSLPLFAGAHGRLVMVRQATTPEALVEAVSADAAALGFDAVQAVAVPERQTAVA